jgi:hypothetical protein
MMLMPSLPRGAALATLALALLVSASSAAECNGAATPGPRNTHPIDDAAPVYKRSVKNGKLYTVGHGDDTKDLLHVWGTPYENGMAMGTMLGPKLISFVREVYTYTEGQVISNLGNETWCNAHAVRCHGLREVMHMGLEVALNLSYHQTAPYIKPYVIEELQGLADSTHGALSLVDMRNVMWLGEITRGSCSMFGAKDSATRESRDGKLLQLRALDWDTDGPFKNYATIVVYHPSAEGAGGHAWANVGFSGWTASITGFSSSQLALSEIGVSYPDATFGPETYLAKGYPFGYLIRDILQFDKTLEDATERITKATRTCDLILVRRTTRPRPPSAHTRPTARRVYIGGSVDMGYVAIVR